ncbi:MAG: cytochrome b/b6 domain-containing protein [Betaproteobacteria bacterium]
MNAVSASRADNPAANSVNDTSTTGRKILVWDAPVRVFHWLMVASFAGAWLTAESERWRMVHVTLGYTMAGLVAFRILWGLVGTRYARFSSFVRGPAAVKDYLRGILRGRPAHHTGHNPAGALAIIALMGLAIAITASGWATFNDVGGKWLEEGHEVAATVMLMLVGAHVAGALFSSWLHRENLIGAMISGRKPGKPEDGIRRAWHTVAALMLAAVLGFWWLQYRDAPVGDGLAAAPAAVAVAPAKAPPNQHRGD